MRSDFLRIFLAIVIVSLLFGIIPAVWAAARRANLDRTVRILVPVAVMLAVVSGIVVSSANLQTKLILVAALGPISLLAAVGSYPVYARAKKKLSPHGKSDKGDPGT